MFDYYNCVVISIKKIIFCVSYLVYEKENVGLEIYSSVAEHLSSMHVWDLGFNLQQHTHTKQKQKDNVNAKYIRKSV